MLEIAELATKLGPNLATSSLELDVAAVVLIVLSILLIQAWALESLGTLGLTGNRKSKYVFSPPLETGDGQRSELLLAERSVQTMTVPVLVIGADDQVIFANPAAKRWLSLPPTSKPRLPDALAVMRADKDALRNCVAEARSRGFAKTHLRLRVAAETEAQPHRVSVSPLSVAPFGSLLVVTLEDTSEELADSIGLLRSRKLDLLTCLAGSIVHDINNRLSVIRAGTDLLMIGTDANSPNRMDLEEISTATGEAARLAAELLALSRPSPTSSPCDPAASILELQAHLRRFLGQKAQLIVDIPASIAEIGLTTGEFQQVVLHLVKNAKEALVKGGIVRVSLRDPANDFIILSVEDNGTGILPAATSRAFTPFFTTKSKQGNLGLGLPTVRAIVEHAGGRIETESSEGLGTKFTVYLPKAKDKRMNQDTPSVRASGTGPTLLVLDDEEPVRRLLVRLLGRDGYDVSEAANVPEALEKAKNLPRLDVWVTDANIDGTDATDAVDAMRLAHPHVAIVLVSGREPEPERMDVLLARGVRFLAKPFTPAELRQAIDEAYRRGSATSGVVSLASETAAPPEQQVR